MLDLPALAKRKTNRKAITLRSIDPTQSHAQELASLYLAVVNVWSRNTDRILAGYSPQTVDAPRDHQVAIDQAEGEVSRLIFEFGTRVQQWTLRIERWHRSKWAAAVKAATGIELGDLLTATPVQETLEAFIARNVALVRNISDEARGRISDSVYRAYQQRTGARELAKEVREATGMARRRALRVSSDQNVKLAAGLDRERQAEAGISKFVWRHSGKRHPREDHVDRDGNVYSWSDPPAVLPGELPFCGCRAKAHLDLS